MAKTINVKTEDFKRGIYNLINNADLPISNIYLVFKLLYNEIEQYYYQALNNENEPEIEIQSMGETGLEKVQEKVEENA